MSSTSEYASDGTTIVEIINEFETRGFTGGFVSGEGGTLRCVSCQAETPASAARVEALRRIEGASDPADMAAVAALQCSKCDAKGTIVLSYGPDTSLEDADVLAALETITPE